MSRPDNVEVKESNGVQYIDVDWESDEDDYGIVIPSTKEQQLALALKEAIKVEPKKETPKEDPKPIPELTQEPEPEPEPRTRRRHVCGGV